MTVQNKDRPKSLQSVLDVLMPPLRFAARESFAHVHRLRGFESLLESTIAQHEDLDHTYQRIFKNLGQGFESAPPEVRRQKIEDFFSQLDIDQHASPHNERLEKQDRRGQTLPAHQKESPETDTKTAGKVAKTASSKASARRGKQASKRMPVKTQERPPQKSTSNGGSKMMTQRQFLESPLEALRGIGPSKAKAFQSRDIQDVGDLLYCIPRTYADRRHVSPIGQLQDGVTAVVHGEIISSAPIGRGRGARYEVTLDDGTGRVKLVFFHYKQFDMHRRFTPGKAYTAAGVPVRYKNAIQMVHPNVAQGEAIDFLSGILPVYPEFKGLHSAELSRAIQAALNLLQPLSITDNLPSWIRQKVSLETFEETMNRLHAPSRDITDDELAELMNRTSTMHRRLAFEELLMLQIAMKLKSADEIRPRAIPLPGERHTAIAKETFPFKMTAAQSRTAEEILNDLSTDRPMARLLQGDVGAGKTAVATIGLVRTFQAGHQSVLMAPTEILAEQHFKTVKGFLSPLGIKVGYLTGSVKTKERKLLLARLKNGEIHCLVGTHAVISDDVVFKSLGFCVIDEQHRFGVAQRAKLQNKGLVQKDGTSMDPHLLIMTATPIPRSLALTCYGDLAVSVLDELPPGRQPIETRVLRGEFLEALEAIQQTLHRGNQAYVVYPLIEESEKLDLADATKGYEKLQKRLGHDSVALIHGKLNADEREATMRKFARGDISVLVSTTVIEVGVDVPKATCMVIVNAERFGLSQLHQLRGRVGRGKDQSSCYLLMGERGAGKDAFRRLAIMEKSNDGFLIAEEDLAIRGPGDFLGTRQSGVPNLIFADLLQHAHLLESAKEIADEIVDAKGSERDPQYEALIQTVRHRFQRKVALMDAG